MELHKLGDIQKFQPCSCILLYRRYSMNVKRANYP